MDLYFGKKTQEQLQGIKH